MAGKPLNTKKKDLKPRGSAARNGRSAEPLSSVPINTRPVNSGPVNVTKKPNRPSGREPFERKPSEIAKGVNLGHKPSPSSIKKEPFDKQTKSSNLKTSKSLAQGSRRQNLSKPLKEGVRGQAGSKSERFRLGNSRPVRKGNIFRRILGAVSALLLVIAAIPLWGMISTFLRRGRAGRTVALGFIAVLFVALLSVLIYFLTRDNAFSITVGSEQVAIIRMGNEDISEELKKQAVLRIENRLGTRILISEQIEFVPIRAASSHFQPVDEAIIKISEALTYRVEAVAISVMGTRMTTVRNQDEVERIFDHLKEPHIGLGVNFVDVSFVEDVLTEPIYTDEESLDDLDMALRILTAPMESAQDYIVARGDSLGLIASRAAMSLSDLLMINPNIDASRPIQPGDVIHLLVERPQISVRTVEERTRTVEIEPPLEYIYNPQMRSPARRTVQIGTIGSANVVEHVIRINSMEVERLEIERIITLPAQPEIIEVGTG